MKPSFSYNILSLAQHLFIILKLFIIYDADAFSYRQLKLKLQRYLTRSKDVIFVTRARVFLIPPPPLVRIDLF